MISPGMKQRLRERRDACRLRRHDPLGGLRAGHRRRRRRLGRHRPGARCRRAREPARHDRRHRRDAAAPRWSGCRRCDEAWVKPALDLGAEGIVFPLVGTAEEAAACVALTRYPPHGRRGWGPFVAHARWGVGLFDYLPQRGDETVCMLLIETRAAVENIEAICRVEGVDGMIIARSTSRPSSASPAASTRPRSARPWPTWSG